MCGIIGVTNLNNYGSGEIIYKALTRLEYRGYDSVGVAIINDGKINIEKEKGSIEVVNKQLELANMRGKIGIGHSRWATHGPPSKANAHPHLSQEGRVAIVHNGIIENFFDLKKELEGLGYEFRSDTDTEVLPHLIEYFLSQNMTVLEAIAALRDKIKGTFAIVMITLAEPDKIYAFRRDNPLVLGIGTDANYCASDIPAFLPYTNNVIILRDNELAILEPTSYQILDLTTMEKKERKPKKVTWTAEAAQKGGYPHFMLKEIHEQPQVLRTQLATQQEQFEQGATLLESANKIILVAAGTAYYASLTAYFTLPHIAKKVVIPTVAAEWDNVANFVDEQTLILTVSQSGETLDTIKAVKDGINKGAKILAVVNVTDSTLTRLADLVIYIHAGPEIGVAATKTYVAQAFAVWRLAYGVAQLHLPDAEQEAFAQAIRQLPDLVSEIIQNSELLAREVAKWMKHKHSAFYLGRGISFVSAAEGALKMKEIAYVHAEAYPAGESKHGPIALVEDDYPVIFVLPNDSTRDKMIGAIQEMKARGAKAIGVIEEGDSESLDYLDHAFIIPKGASKYLSNIAYVIPLQLFAYYTTTQRGHNPDRPRNLAKSVTVE